MVGRCVSPCDKIPWPFIMSNIAQNLILDLLSMRETAIIGQPVHYDMLVMVAAFFAWHIGVKDEGLA